MGVSVEAPEGNEALPLLPCMAREAPRTLRRRERLMDLFDMIADLLTDLVPGIWRRLRRSRKTKRHP